MWCQESAERGEQRSLHGNEPTGAKPSDEPEAAPSRSPAVPRAPGQGHSPEGQVASAGAGPLKRGSPDLKAVLSTPGGGELEGETQGRESAGREPGRGSVSEDLPSSPGALSTEA